MTTTPASKNPRNISGVRFKYAVALGAGAEMVMHLMSSDKVDFKPITLVFDSDSRFLRVTTQAGVVNLIPLENVASILMAE